MPPTLFVRRRDPADGRHPGYYPPHFVDDFPVVVNPQEAPDPPRRGETPARHPLSFVNFFLHPGGYWPENFRVGHGAFIHPAADTPLGAAKMQPNRANIRRPQPVTYGSQFEVG